MGILLILCGVATMIFAVHLSNLERRMITGNPSMKVTGWSGTNKGVIAWRLVGILLVIVGSVVMLERAFS
jgi:hypothetical protein